MSNPIRPLGSVSDFVVDEFPLLLANVRQNRMTPDDLAQRCEDKLGAVSVPYLLEHFRGHHDIALLDMLFMESGIVHSGGNPGTLLQSMVDRSAQSLGRIPAMTYEDLIFANPKGDMRVFCEGTIGVSEKKFYRNQMRAERQLKQAAIFCRTAIEELAKANDQVALRDMVCSTLKAAASETYHMAQGVTAMNAELPVEHFAVIRQYFAAHPFRGFKGPSGVFSLGLFNLELLLAGDRLLASNPEYLAYYLEENVPYLPRVDMQEARDLYTRAASGRTVFALLDRISGSGIDADLAGKCRDAAIEIGLAIRLFRGNHYKAVKHQIPDVLAGSTPGTGEADAGNLLIERMKIRHE
ncbi:MAG: hypothetical protein A3B34_02750 [Candidatus Sungbacteria bacterium RIFCSPLOWO2_01_FULL_54_21]|nr:MAG: hypothetical protein A3B34_02750 [Candidatus Sungbacteria bacterium RIFCSPLOWO2_01_FULL_54_21]